MEGNVRLSVLVTSEANKLLLTLMHDTMSISKAEVLRKAMALLAVAVDARKRGLHIGLASDPSVLTQTITGIVDVPRQCEMKLGD